MNRLTPPAAAGEMPLAFRVATAVCLATGGWVHAQLYLHGYRAIPVIGPSFLLQASGSFAVACLLLVAAPMILRLGAAGLSVGALLGFVLSRTVGVFGFIERGLDPAPQALLSLIFEIATLVILMVARRPPPVLACY